MRFYSTATGNVTPEGSDFVSGPFNRAAAALTLALTTSDASVSLAPGLYAVFADATTETTVLGIGPSTTGQPPASAAPEASGIVCIPPRVFVEIEVDTNLSLHARVLAGTATLRITRRSSV
jgi:hypothetical protein